MKSFFFPCNIFSVELHPVNLSQQFKNQMDVAKNREKSVICIFCSFFQRLMP